MSDDEGRRALAVGDAAFRRCREMGDFLAVTVIPLLLPVAVPGTAGEVILAQLIRIDYWLRSLGKMDERTDYQPVSAGCRAILECAIDVVLLRAKPDDYQKILDWEDSAKLKHAEALARHCAKDPGARRDAYDRPIEWAKDSKARINARRLVHRWVEKRDDGTEKAKHPNRWTNQSLASDAQAADRAQELFAADEGPPVRLERYYETRYRELCWDTHGSGNVRRLGNAGLLPAIGATAFYDSARLSIAAASWVVAYFHLWDDAMLARFDAAAGRMESIYQATLQAHGISDDE